MSEPIEGKQVREEFCGVCAAGVAALAGAGIAGAGASSKDAYSAKKKTMLWSGVILLLLAVIMGLYFYWRPCGSCR